MWGFFSWSLGRVVAVHTPPRAVDATRTVLLAKECCGN